MEWIEWLKAHEQALAWLGVAGFLMLVGSLLALPLVIASMPSDYLVRPERKAFPDSPFRQFLHLLKNLLGGVMALAGLLMLVLPGQGVLTILIGLSLIDFPGKKRLQIRLARVAKIRSTIAWIRRKAGREPLILPEHGTPAGESPDRPG